MTAVPTPPKYLMALPKTIEHGTVEGYDWGCVCNECIAANDERHTVAGLTAHRDAAVAGLTLSKKQVTALQRRAEKAERVIRRVTGYAEKCAELRMEPSTGGLRKALDDTE